jgi:hypothetical protein
MPEIGGVSRRRRELGVVAAFLDGLRTGPSGLLLEGDAGIGKTTVWWAGVSDAAARSCLVLRSRRHRGLDPVLREADMTAFVQLAAYEAVIIPGGSIALLDGRKGGRLVVDIPVSQPAAGHEAMR